MPLSAPWELILDDNPVEELPLLALMTRLKPEDDPQWSRASLTKISALADASKVVVVWDVLLNFWRLKQTEPREPTSDSRLWCDHFRAVGGG